MYDPDKYKASRSKPSQARGKERVRVILSSALVLFKGYGIEEVTTNDIAKAASIPIGSLYRYFPNKDAIIVALVELYVEDLSSIFTDISKHPFLQYLSWDEVLLLLVDAWVNYSRLNGPFTFLYAERSNPRLHIQSKLAWQRFRDSFSDVIKRRCAAITGKETLICFQLCTAAVELGVNDEDTHVVGTHPHHEAVGIIALYMLKACQRHGGHEDVWA